MAIAQFFFVCLVLLQGALLVQSDIVCKDLQEEILCSAQASEAGKCYEWPWNGQCRKTCGRCDECYDAQNLVTCEDQLKKGNCGDEEVAHACSQTCHVLSCAKEATKGQLADAMGLK
ncbi:hypothetical protein OS493_033300 [Desmophyllum pertusum]|uniref:ShKT domain-containing protein n=1 Tax=Desmophyllum pertusum TaxID=174260 RepID=A0A9X0CV24_9CNID|nr:hypothetical protein OS493_033300 [Desmophyllum pertusum]